MKLTPYQKLAKYLKDREYQWWKLEGTTLTFQYAPRGERNKLLKSYIKRLFGDNWFYNYDSRTKIQRISYKGLTLIYHNY